MMKTKKKSGKRFLSWLLAAVMIITLMPATAFAEPPTESSGAVTSYCPEPEGDTDVSVGEMIPLRQQKQRIPPLRSLQRILPQRSL